jgi:hypothetical protein
MGHSRKHISLELISTVIKRLSQAAYTILLRPSIAPPRTRSRILDKAVKYPHNVAKLMSKVGALPVVVLAFPPGRGVLLFASIDEYEDLGRIQVQVPDYEMRRYMFGNAAILMARS